MDSSRVLDYKHRVIITTWNDDRNRMYLFVFVSPAGMRLRDCKHMWQFVLNFLAENQCDRFGTVERVELNLIKQFFFVGNGKSSVYLFIFIFVYWILHLVCGMRVGRSEDFVWLNFGWLDILEVDKKMVDMDFVYYNFCCAVRFEYQTNYCGF